MEHGTVSGDGQQHQQQQQQQQQQQPQQVVIGGQQLQVVQMNQPHMIQGPNGHQIMVHALPAGGATLQMAAPVGQNLQLVPVSSLQGVAGGNASGGQAMLIGGQQTQIIQGPDGQTYLYQPPMVDNPLLHHSAVINVNGSLVQIGTPQSATLPQNPQQHILNAGNIVMMVGGNATNAAASPAPAAAAVSAFEQQDEEPLLYVNAKQYRRILRRRQARANLLDSGKIPKERRKYLHESRHRHAMNRVRGEGGRFHSNTDEKTKTKNADASLHREKSDIFVSEKLNSQGDLSGNIEISTLKSES